VIGFDCVVRVLLHDVAGSGEQLVEHPRVGRYSISAHFARARAVLQGAGEKPAGGRQIPLLEDQDVDDLPVLIDRLVQIDSPPGNLDVGFVHEPAVACGVPAGPCHVDQQWGEPLYPPDVIHLDAPLSQQLLHVAVRQAVTEVPAHRHREHFGRKAVSGKPDLDADTWAERPRISPACPIRCSADATAPSKALIS
jgi:hypothetical protein